MSNWINLKPELKQDRTRVSKSMSTCGVCGHPRHALKLYLCKKLGTDWKKAVNTVGACTECLEVHEKSITCTSEFLCRKYQNVKFV